MTLQRNNCEVIIAKEAIWCDKERIQISVANDEKRKQIDEGTSDVASQSNGGCYDSVATMLSRYGHEL